MATRLLSGSARHEIDIAVTKLQIDGDTFVKLKEILGDRQYVEAAKHARRAHNQPSGRLAKFTRCLSFHFCHVRDHLTRACEVSLPGGSQGQFAGRSNQKGSAQMLFKLSDLSGECCHRHAMLF